MKPMNANELLAGLALARPVPITAVVTDSRKVQPGCIFVCFPGERVDGHDYAAKAYQAGAEYVIANHPVEGVPEDHLVICESSYLAMIRMASNYRTLFSPLMIGVTGSVGKTTTKEFCYAVLSAFGNTLKTEGNQNNEIGLPKTLFRLEDTPQYAVVEMGMSHLGEIARMVRAARPSAGIITMIGVSHLENLGTRENILKAKMEICQGLPDGAPLVLNADDDLLPTAQIPGRLRPVWFGISSADVRAINIHTVGEGTGFTLVDNVDGETYEFSVTIPTAGVHTVYDALAAYTAATRLGLERARAARALASYQTTGMRQNIVQHGGVTFIEDCYNASPDSMKAALQILHDRQPGPGGRRIAVLGDMLELGAASEPGHRQTGKWAADAADLLVAYGPLSAAMAEAARQKGLQTIHCQAAEEVVEYLRQNVRPGDVILGLPSTGVHSNGYSLVRKVIGVDGIKPGTPEAAAKAEELSRPLEELGGASLADALLAPTRIYVKPILELLRGGAPVHAIAHITGGGITENLNRALADDVDAVVTRNGAEMGWDVPPVITYVSRQAELAPNEACKTFNMGVGLCLIVAPEDEAAVTEALVALGEKPFRVGECVEGSGKVVYSDER